LVIFIHGGGFTHGYKAQAYERYQSQIKEFLSKNIAFATIDYRFLHESDKGVITSLEDSKRCLQFIKYYASSFNIDKNKVGCFGSSAGAGTSLWLALNDDMADPNSEDLILRESTRMPAVGAIATQATYDIMRWEEVFSDYNISIDRIPPQFLQQLNPFYGLSDFSEVHDPEFADSIGIENVVYIPGYEIEDPSGEGLIDFFDRNLNSK